MHEDRQSHLRTARLIASALTAGPVLFWIVAWVMVGRFGQGIVPPESSLTPSVAGWIWLGVALPALVVGFIIRQQAVDLVEQSRGVGDSKTAVEVLGKLQAKLLVAWALFEGAALVSGVFFLLFAVADFVWGGVAVLGLGMFMSFPRREWYEPFEMIADRTAAVTD